LDARIKDLQRENQSRKITPKQLKRTLDDVLDKYGVEPAEELVKLAVERISATGAFILDVDQRIQIWRDLLQYRMPKLRAVETHGTLDHTITVEIKRFGDTDDVGQVIEIPPENVE
jgi:hypothetical protein